MVEGFEDPPGDAGALNNASSGLLSIEQDLTTESSTVQRGFAEALEDWHANRADGFRSAGTSTAQALDAGVGLLEGAATALGVYAGALRQATDDIADLRRQADRALADAGDGPPGPGGATGGGEDPRAKVERLRREADAIRADLKSKAATASSALSSATGKLVPGGESLSPEDIARRVTQASGVDAARRAMAQGTLTAEGAWAALGGGKSQQNPLESFFDTWGGFKPPTTDNPVDRSLYVLGRLGWAGGKMASWMTKVTHGTFSPRGPGGRFVSVANMSFLDRLKAGAGRFPTAKGLTRWQQLKGFDKGAAFNAKGWRGGQYGRWSTAGKWLGRGGTALAFASAGWSEWQDSAGYPTDERVGRTVTKAATTAAGGWAGAEVGAWAGGAIGTAICPGVGTVIGAGIGGLIGGFAGSKLGGYVGDKIKDVGGEIGHGIASGVKKLKFW